MIYFIVIMDYEYGNNFIFKKNIFFNLLTYIQQIYIKHIKKFYINPKNNSLTIHYNQNLKLIILNLSIKPYNLLNISKTPTDLSNFNLNTF